VYGVAACGKKRMKEGYIPLGMERNCGTVRQPVVGMAWYGGMVW
jgi:hypothetical protein